MKIITLITFFMFLYSCRPEKQPTQFTKTIKPQAGELLELETNEDTPLEIIYELEKQPDSIALTFELKEGPQHGVLENCVNIGELKIRCNYIPDKDFNGVDKFGYEISDGDFKADNLGWIQINILPVSDKPIAAEDMSLSTPENQTLSFMANKGQDIDSPQLNYKLITPPSNGSLEGCLEENSDLSCAYIPNKDFYGHDSFSYRVVDMDGMESDEVTTVDIKVHNYPELVDQEEIVDEDKLTHIFTFAPAIDYDSAPEDIEYKIVKFPGEGTLKDCFVNNNTSCTYEAKQGYEGTDEILVQALDSDGLLSNIAKITFHMSINKAPMIGANQEISVQQNKLVSFEVSKASDVDSPESELVYYVVENPKNGVLKNCLGKAIQSCTYEPTKGFYGSDSFSYKVRDQRGLSSATAAVVSIQVIKNQNPVVGQNQSFTVKQYQFKTFQINPATDVDSEQSLIKYEIVSAPQNGVLSNCFESTSILSCTYTPSNGYYGNDALTYRAVDDFGNQSQLATVSFSIIKNENPVIGDNQNITLKQYESKTFQVFPAQDADSAQNVLKYEVVTAPKNGVLSNCFEVTSILSCTYTPINAFYGVDSFTYLAMDEFGNKSQLGTVMFTIIKNANPVIGANQNFTLNQDESKTFQINPATDEDSEQSVIKYEIVGAPQNGTLFNCFLAVDILSCTYIPNKNYYGSDSLTYRAQDEYGNNSELATVTFTIEKVDLPPSVGADQLVNVVENIAKSFTVNIGSDQDSNVSELTYIVVDNPLNGVLSDCFAAMGNRSCTYMPNKDYFGEDSLTYKIIDPTGKESTATATVNFIVNSRPVVAADLNLSMYVDSVLNFSVPLATDNDSAAGDLTYSIVSVSSGAVSNCFPSKGLRSCSFTPKAGFIGDIIIEYKVTDETGLSSVANGKVLIAVAREKLLAVENFQTQDTKIQLTWVIDNSGSMKDEQTALANSFSSFVDNLMKDGKAIFPFTSLVTTTDSMIQGNYIGKLDSTNAEANPRTFKTNYEAALNVGVDGSGSEKALVGAADAYIEQPSFYQDQSAFSIYILVSDETEQSLSYTIEEWLQAFQETKDHPNKVKFYSIMNPDELQLCKSYYPDQVAFCEATAGRYNKLSQLSGGSVYSLYGSDFNAILNDISTSIIKLAGSFLLKNDREIIESTIKVYVNDVLLPNSEWSYDAKTKAISLTNPSIDSVSVKITYDYYAVFQSVP